MVGALADVGVERTSLLLVPNYHRRGKVSNDADFCSWLHWAQRHGHEMIMHGNYHAREQRAKETFRDRVMTRFYTAGEGEFYDLSEFEAEQRLREARAVFRMVGVSSRGFIAPAWLLSQGSERALKAMGFDYTVKYSTIRDLTAGLSSEARTLVWSLRSSWRAKCSLLFNKFQAARTKKDLVVRVSLHPPDFHNEKAWQQALTLIRSLKESREHFTYGEWISLQRQIRAEATRLGTDRVVV